MKSENQKLVPLKFIRIAKDMLTKDMAEKFGVASSYISEVETGRRDLNNIHKIRYGLGNLNISLNDYLELLYFCEQVEKMELNYSFAYKIVLMKAIGIVNPDLKEKSEKTILKYIPNNNTTYSR